MFIAQFFDVLQNHLLFSAMHLLATSFQFYFHIEYHQTYRFMDIAYLALSAPLHTSALGAH